MPGGVKSSYAILIEAQETVNDALETEDMLFTSGFHSLLEMTRSSNRIEPRDSQAREIDEAA